MTPEHRHVLELFVAIAGGWGLGFVLGWAFGRGHRRVSLRVVKRR